MELLTLPRRARGPSGLVHAIHTPPGGTTLLVLTGHDEGASRLTRWDLFAGRATATASVVTDDEHGICYPPPRFSADYRVMTLGGFVKRVGKRRRVPLGGNKYPEPFAITPDGRTVFGGVYSVRLGEAWPVLRWDLAGAFRRGVREVAPAEPLVYPGDAGIVAGAVSPDGAMLAAVPYTASRMFRWRLPGCEPLPVVRVPGAADMAAVAFSPDGNTIALTERDGVHLLPADGGRAVTVECGPRGAFALTPDSRRLVTVAGRTAAVWDAATGERVAAYNWGKAAGDLGAVAVLPDGLTAVAGGTRGRLVRWDI